MAFSTTDYRALVGWIWFMGGGCMRISSTVVLAGFCLGSTIMFSGAEVYAQSAMPAIALKSGESTELQTVYWVINCASIVIGSPQIEILEGPAELTLEIKEGMVLPRRQNCAKLVPGGTVVATAKDVKESSQAKVTYRIKFKTKAGDRQESHVYSVSLFP
jgi:hypothetical protein